MDTHNLCFDILNKLQTGVVVYGPDAQIVFSNPRAAELPGLSDDQMRGPMDLQRRVDLACVDVLQG